VYVLHGTHESFACQYRNPQWNHYDMILIPKWKAGTVPGKRSARD
jgi:hypothetical protein